MPCCHYCTFNYISEKINNIVFPNYEKFSIFDIVQDKQIFKDLSLYSILCAQKFYYNSKNTSISKNIQTAKDKINNYTSRSSSSNEFSMSNSLSNEFGLSKIKK